MPVDILYPYSVISEQFANMSAGSKSAPTAHKQSIKSKIIEAYKRYSLNHIFADAWKEQDFGPLPISVGQANSNQIKQVAELLKASKRPLAILGSQSVLRPYGPDVVANLIKELGIPVYLNGAARGLMGKDYELQFRHARKEAVREADLVLLLGAICDFRLSYGQIFKRPTKVVSINRSINSAKLNAGIFWQPTLAIESDVGKFLQDLIKYRDRSSALPASGGNTTGTERMPLSVDKQWLEALRNRDDKKDLDIKQLSNDAVDRHLNPLKVLHQLKKTFDSDDTILVADGGDFVASASYIMKPCGPLRWLDPGPYGTLGCGAGFALAAKLHNPEKQVVAIMGDGAFGYAIPELDTFVRHKIPVFWLIGNDSCWTQIAREQLPMLGSSIGCDLAPTNYHEVAKGFGAKGYLLNEEKSLVGENNILVKAKNALVKNGDTVVVNSLIGKTKFRDGSISV